MSPRGRGRKPAARMARIDTHQHVIPPRYAELLRMNGIRPGGIDLPDWSRDGALRMMDRNGIRAGIVSVSTPGALVELQGVAEDESQAIARGRRIAREVNEYAAELVQREPERFGFFATLTLPDVEGALDELAYAVDELHADGVILLANAGGRYLGDAAFAPLLAELDRRETVVFVHPGELPAPEVPGVPTFTADFLLDTTRTVIDLILSGAMERYPKIRFILAHAGGFVPFIEYRVLLTMLQRRPSYMIDVAEKMMEYPFTRPLVEIVKKRYLRVFRKFYWDTALSASPAALPSLLAVADHSHITYGSDWPFAPEAAVKFTTSELDRYPMNPFLRAAINHNNVKALFPRFAGK
ncbi:MAG: amidohydrolase family protein [Propionibacteriaceae bacterium]|nr:amidohydrolase family protein [Propionibacteriaceae bacterium]